MKPPIKIPAGWRKLRDRELVRNGDRFVSGLTGTNWLACNTDERAGPCSNGSTYIRRIAKKARK